MKYLIKCDNGHETYYAYRGVAFPKEKAEAEAEAIRKQWPGIKTELVPAEDSKTGGDK